MLTGGEPLLRPKLVCQITEIAHSVGTKVSLSSGLFFAAKRSIPPAIANAITKVDHLIASLDQFHEREVCRADVLRVLKSLHDKGKDISLHIVGHGSDDPYVSEVVEDVRQTFSDQVPMIVAEVQPVGRAAEWMPESRKSNTADYIDPVPCSLAAWPVVTFDGTVALCCNQKVVDGPSPPHLKVGHITTETWTTVRNRHTSPGMRRALRVFGPQYLASHFGKQNPKSQGYCETCWHLSDDPELVAEIEQFGSRPTMAFVEEEVGKVLGRLPLQGVMPRYADLAYLGASALHKEQVP